MADERRTLEIEARVRDFVSKGFRTMAQSVAKFAKSAAGALKGIFDRVVNLKNAVAGFVVFLAARRAFSFLKSVATDLDFIVKTSDRLQITTKSLQELTFVAQLAGLQFESFASGLAVMSKNLDAARDGSKLQAEAFRTLGVEINALPLGPGGKIDMIELLAKMADGLENVEDPAEKVAALMNSLGRQGKELGPLLAGGSAAIREQAEEFERLGGVLDVSQLGRAAAFNDALLRLETSIDSVLKLIFIEFAPGVSSVFEQLARLISENRERILEFVNSVAAAIGRALEFIARLFVELIRAFENLPVIGPGKLVSPGVLEELREVEQTLDAIRQQERAGVPTPVVFGSSNLAGNPEGLKRFTKDQVDALIPRREELEARQRELAAILEGGMAKSLEEAFQGIQDDVRKFTRDLDRALGDAAEEEGTGETVFKVIAESFAQQRQKLAGQRSLLDVMFPTEDVQKQIAAIDNALQQVQFRELFADGVINAEELAAAERAVNEELGRTIQSIEAAVQSQTLTAQRAALQEAIPSEEITAKLAEIDAALRILSFEEMGRRGVLSMDEVKAAIDRVKQSLEDTGEEAPKTFVGGFAEASDKILEKWADFSAAGAEAANKLVQGGLDGLTNALGDVIAGTKSAKDAFKDLAVNMLKQLAAIIAKMIVMKSLQAITGTSGGFSFEQGGIMPGVLQQSYPVKAYERGGVARSPQLAVFGEGANKAEAFVPLPDGRTIPVTLTGGRGPMINIQITAMDGRDVHRVLVDNRHSILGIWDHAMSSDNSMRQRLQRAAG